MKKKFSKIKRYLIKKPLILAGICFAVGLVLSGTTFAIIQKVNNSNLKQEQDSKTKSTTVKSEAKTEDKKTPSPNPSSSDSPAPSSSTSSSPSPAPKKTPSAPKSSPSQAYQDSCNKKNSDSYVKYNKAIAAESQLHQANLAELQVAYDRGDFEEAGESEELAYQIAIEMENDRWKDATNAIYITRLEEQSSNVCY